MPPARRLVHRMRVWGAALTRRPASMCIAHQVILQVMLQVRNRCAGGGGTVGSPPHGLRCSGKGATILRLPAGDDEFAQEAHAAPRRSPHHGHTGGLAQAAAHHGGCGESVRSLSDQYTFFRDGGALGPPR